MVIFGAGNGENDYCLSRVALNLELEATCYDNSLIVTMRGKTQELTQSEQCLTVRCGTTQRTNVKSVAKGAHWLTSLASCVVMLLMHGREDLV